MSNFAILEFDVSTSQAQTDWKRMLTHSTHSLRAIHGTLTSGDTITVEFTNERLVPDQGTMQTAVSTANVAVMPVAVSAVFNYTYGGNYRWVRVQKTGANGVARVLVEA